MRHIATNILRLPDGEVVLQRRSLDFKLSPGKLGFFGGHMEANETPIQAAKRELGEETSLPIDRLIFTEYLHFAMQPDSGHPDEVDYTVFIVDIPKAEFEVLEGDRFEVYTIEEALAREDITRSTRLALEKLGKE